MRFARPAFDSELHHADQLSPSHASSRYHHQKVWNFPVDEPSSFYIITTVWRHAIASEKFSKLYYTTSHAHTTYTTRQ